MLKYKNENGQTQELEFRPVERKSVCRLTNLVRQQWITRIEVFADDEDLEGLKFIYESGQSQEFRANYDIPGPGIHMKGHLLGFKALFGLSEKDADDQPISIQVYQNTCMCPVSFFVKLNDLNNMEIVAYTATDDETQEIQE